VNPSGCRTPPGAASARFVAPPAPESAQGRAQLRTCSTTRRWRPVLAGASAGSSGVVHTRCPQQVGDLGSRRV